MFLLWELLGHCVGTALVLVRAQEAAFRACIRGLGNGFGPFWHIGGRFEVCAWGPRGCVGDPAWAREAVFAGFLGPGGRCGGLFGVAGSRFGPRRPLWGSSGAQEQPYKETCFNNNSTKTSQSVGPLFPLLKFLWFHLLFVCLAQVLSVALTFSNH